MKTYNIYTYLITIFSGMIGFIALIIGLMDGNFFVFIVSALLLFLCFLIVILSDIPYIRHYWSIFEEARQCYAQGKSMDALDLLRQCKQLAERRKDKWGLNLAEEMIKLC
jgi:hypothetical protein